MTSFKTPKGTELPIMSLKGKPYLVVAQRLIWFRETHPLWTIATTLVEHTKDYTLFRAEIRDEAGRIIASGHQDCYGSDFQDHLAKAETSAIGRALALCGFGTQFASDELDEGSRLSDAPLTLHNPLQHAAGSHQPEAGDGHPAPSGVGLGAYRIPFGKHARKGLHEIEAGELSGYCEYLERQSAKEPGKPMRQEAVEFIAKAREFLSLMDWPAVR